MSAFHYSTRWRESQRMTVTVAQAFYDPELIQNIFYDEGDVPDCHCWLSFDNVFLLLIAKITIIYNIDEYNLSTFSKCLSQMTQYVFPSSLYLSRHVALLSRWSTTPSCEPKVTVQLRHFCPVELFSTWTRLGVDSSSSRIVGNFNISNHSRCNVRDRSFVLTVGLRKLI